MNVILIRHGKTKGNIEHRFVGATDEPLCEEGIREIKNKNIITALPEHIFVSPMKRCIQTAKLLYKDYYKGLGQKKQFEQKMSIVDDFREYDFGEYEGKNHEELMELSSYREWIEDGGSSDIPAGEGLIYFKNRVIRAFDLAISQSERHGCKNIAFVVHGGTIMSICEKYDSEKKSYYDYMLENGACYTAAWKCGQLIKEG